MAVAGTLEIQLLANMARLQTDMTQAKSVVGSAMADVSRSVSQAKAILGTLGVGLGIGAIVALGKSVIDATARFKDLAQEAGTSASQLSRFEAPARMAGLGLDTVSGAMFKLSKASLEAKDANSASAQALNAIGISTKQLKGLKPDEMFELIARQISKYSDGLEKNNVMQELFGKSGKEMNRVIAEIAASGELAATVTDAEAEAADRFGDQLIELKMNGEKFWRQLAGPGIAAMNDIVRVFIDAKREGGLLQGVINALSETFTKMAGTELEQVNKQIEIARKAQERIDNRGAVANALFTSKEQIELANSLNGLLLRREQIQKGIFSDELIAQNKRALAILDEKKAINFDPAARAAAIAAAKKAEADAIKAAKEQLDAYVKAAEAALAMDEQIAREIAELTKKRDDAVLGAEKVIANIEFETSALRMSSTEREIAIALRALETSGITKQDAAYESLAGRIRQSITEQQAVRAEIEASTAAQRNSASAWEDLADRVINGFGNMRAALKRFVQDLIAMFAKKYFLQMVAGVTGNSALGSVAGQVGQGTAGGAIMDAAGNWISSTALGGAATGAYGSFIAGYQGATLGAGLAGPTTAGASGITGLGASAGGIGATGWGLIIVAAVALYAYLKSKEGGPKIEGTFGQTSILSGAADSQLQQVGTALGESFAQTLQRLGGTGAASFALGLSSDPQGTAPSFLDAIVRNAAGADIYRSEQRNVARGGEAEALQLEAKRALLAALQASTLPQEIADILNSVSAVTGTAEEIDRVTAAAIAFADATRAAAEEAARAAEAAAKLAEEWEGVQQSIDALTGRNRGPGQLDALAAQFAGANPWAAGQSTQQLVDALTTISEQDFANYSEANRALIAQILALAASIKGLDRSVEEVSTAVTTLSTRPEPTDVMTQLIAGFTAKFGGLISSEPTLMDKMALQLKLAQAQITEWQKSLVGMSPYDPTAQGIQGAIDGLKALIGYIQTIGGQTFSGGLLGDISKLTILTAQYGQAKAEELFDLQKWYDGQKALVGGSAEAMKALQDIFDDKWAAILAGTSEALDGTKDRLKDYLQGLLLSPSLTILDPRQQLDIARKQFESALGSGDAGAITGASDAYLRIARQLFASSSDFVSIFEDVYNKIAGVADQPGYNEQMLTASQQQVSIMQDVRDLLRQIAADSADTADATTTMADAPVTVAPR